MRGIRLTTLFTIAGAGWLLVSCSDRGKAPTAVERPDPSMSVLADVTPSSLDPFTYRASIQAYRILQLPDFMIQEHSTRDIVMQRSVFLPGAGAWHTHSGPSFVYVIQGRIKLTEYTDGTCTDTPVRGPGELYFEEGDHIHRAVVVSSENAVLMVTRFNIPVGGPLTNPVSPAPTC